MATFWKIGGESPDFLFSFGKEEKQALLYLSNIEDEGTIHITPELFSTRVIVQKNISCIKRSDSALSFVPNTEEGNGGVVILLSTLSYKEQLDEEKILHSTDIRTRMRKHLEEEDLYDYSSCEVQRIVSEITGRISPDRRNNPYRQALSALDWAHWNIKYSRVPLQIIRRMEKTIRSYPNDSVYSLLRRSFRWNEIPILKNDFAKLTESIIVPKYMNNDFDRARYILNEFDQKYPVLFEQWSYEKCLSASKTIREGVGKCDCKTHVFIALCRSMGIPAMKIDEYLYPVGWHAWALVYLYPYGWVDVDPTNNFCFGRFNHNIHLYRFLRDKFSGDVKLLTPKKTITEKMLKTCKCFYEQQSEHPSSEKLLEILERTHE